MCLNILSIHALNSQSVDVENAIFCWSAVLYYQHTNQGFTLYIFYVILHAQNQWFSNDRSVANHTLERKCLHDKLAQLQSVQQFNDYTSVKNSPYATPVVFK